MDLQNKESFNFRVITGGYLPVAKHWYLDGMLEAGEICPPCTGTANIENEVINISILSIALVSAKKPEKNRFTLSIEDPNIALKKLNDALIIGADQ
jgi:hypothetical protein